MLKFQWLYSRTLFFACSRWGPELVWRNRWIGKMLNWIGVPCFHPISLQGAHVLYSQAEDNSWEFDTLTRNSFAALEDDFANDFGEGQSHSNQATLRANQSRNLPSSLRLLFEDGNAPSPQPEPRRLNLAIPENSMVSQFSPITPESTQENVPPFLPPSRARTPLKNFMSNSHDVVTPDPVQTSWSLPTTDDVDEKQPSNRFAPDSPDEFTRPKLPAEVESLTKPTNAPVLRLEEGRSKREDLDLASASSFQFPQPSKLNQATQRPPYRSIESRPPPIRPFMSQAAHQNAHSLDTSTLSLPQDYAPPSMARSRSATAPIPPPTPSIDSDYSDFPSTIPENRRLAELNFAPSSRNTPGLKDVLKVGTRLPAPPLLMLTMMCIDSVALI